MSLFRRLVRGFVRLNYSTYRCKECGRTFDSPSLLATPRCPECDSSDCQRLSTLYE